VSLFSRANGGRRRHESAEPKLPKGAEAALWSIVEAVPDPRNHLAMVRDLSGEVRVTDVERALLETAYENRVPDLPPPAPLPKRVTTSTPSTTRAPEAAELLLDDDVDLVAMDPYYDLGEIAENAPLTDHLFASAD
jgi:hypothetical protein